jgi:serine/threonine-protein kinase
MTKILAIPGEGERLDRFELVAELAAGGMATVYLARFVGVAGFKRFVAIKRLHPHLAKEQDFIQMFLDEARLAARLHHPNVVPILEIGVQNEQYYLVMEYIEGDTVGHLMARAANVNKKIPVPIVVRIMLDTLTGLNAAHELHDDDGTPLEIVHRDVSPQNILVGVDGVARITDFGVAKAQARLANATQGGQLKGKLAYMSPEQVRGNMTVDRRADVFAAGIVTWELLTGQRLFKAEGEAETLFKVVAAEVPPIRNYEPGVPPEVEVVIKRALAAHPADRFASTADFAEALEQAARTYNLVATVRQTAAFVNEMIGLDISQQREIVRAWLGRSDVSRSGIANVLPKEAPTPLVTPAVKPESIAMSAVAPTPPADELSSLVDDDLDMATRVDDPEEDDATRIQQIPEPAKSAPVMTVGNAPRQQYVSVATSREFQPLNMMGAANNPQLQSTLPSPTGSGQLPPQGPGASGAYPPAPVAFPWPPGAQQQVVPAPAAPKRGLPVWTLLIPAVIIIGGAVFLGLHNSAATKTPAAPPKPTTTATTTATHSDTTAPTTTQTAAVTATITAAPPPTQTGEVIQPIPTVTAEALPTSHPKPHPNPNITYVNPKPQTGPTQIDNKEFGGRR